MSDTLDSDWNLRIGSINVQGGNENGFFEEVAKWGRDIALFDIIACQETKFHADKNTRYLLQEKGEEIKYHGYWASDTVHTMGSGVAFLVGTKWTKYILKTSKYKGRGIALDFGFHSGTHIRIINCYVPANRAEERGKKEFQELVEWVTKEIQNAEKSGMEAVVCGDFNGVVNPALDRHTITRGTLTENALLEWLINNQFTDSFRKLYPE